MKTLLAFALAFLLPSCFAACTDGPAVCVDGPGSKFVDGIEVYRECWNWQRTRECFAPATVNYCAGLASSPDCRIADSKCLSSALTGECLTMERNYQCSEEKDGENLELLDFTHTVTQVKNPGTCGSFLDNPDCFEASSRCIEGPETRIINGIAVYKDCWKKEVDWACASNGVTNSCLTLEAAGCTPKGEPKCSKTDASGACVQYTRSYTCANTGTITGPDISTDTHGSAGFDTLSCENATAGMKCTKLSSECVEEGGSRVIDGVTVTAPCWLEEEVYRCTETSDEKSCGTLEATDGCVVEKQECAERNGPRCIAYRKDIRCQSQEPLHPPEPEITVESQVTVAGPFIWESSCEPIENNPLCTLDNKSCVEYSEDGQCRKWEIGYLCSSPGSMASDCSDLEAEKDCVLVSEDCYSVNDKGECLSYSRTYKCVEREPSVIETTVCRPAECPGGVCGEGDPADTDFGEVLSWLETMRQGAVYGDIDGNFFFSGEKAECSKKVLGFSCCDNKVQAGGSNSEAFGKGLAFAGQATVETIKYVGSPYVYDVLSSSEATSGLLTMLYGNAASGVYNPSLSFYGFGMTLQGGQMYFTFNPGVFAMTVAAQVAMDFLQCDVKEQALMLRKGQRLCTYVGTYCSLDLGLGCVERKEAYCCYNSRLARIITEQGRPQIGKTMGSAKHPDCTGFTIEQLEALDFNAMDLSEFTEEIIREANLNTDAVKDRTDTHVGNLIENDLGGYITPPKGSSGVTNPDYAGNLPAVPPTKKK